MTASRVFLSHTGQDARLVENLKRVLDEAFLGAIDFFASSDDHSLLPGARWQDEVLRALGEAQLLIVICTPESVSRPWINFEAGAGVALQRRVIPVCCQGTTKGGLPSPLSMFQAVDGADPADVDALIESLALPQRRTCGHLR
ncbi:MAG: toll/interleukin-1 receptor domain-containing protein [Acidimicrobiales bacterium]